MPPLNLLAELWPYWSCTRSVMRKSTLLIQEHAMDWLPRRCRFSRVRGFTLAEVLISLLIVAEIATFTIPKIITSQQNTQYRSSAKEAVSMIAAAYQLYTAQNGYSTNIGIAALTQYMNYTAIDSYYADSTAARSCGSWSAVCLKLHNNVYLQYWPVDNFAATATTNGVPFMIDPNGSVTEGTTNGPGKSLYFFLYYNGRVTDMGNLPGPTSWNNGTNFAANPSNVPPWFSW